MKPINSYISKYNLIQNAISQSELYQDALKAFKEGLKEFSFTPQEQANAYATFLAQTTLGLQAQSMDIALRIDITELQAQDLRNKTTLEAQILKAQALRSAIEVDTSTHALEATKASALQEKIKCDVLVKSANDNTAINKNNALVELMNVMGNATSYTVIQKLVDDVNASIKKIGEGGELKYEEDIKALDIDNKKYRFILYTSKNIVSVNENVLFGISHNMGNDVTILWDIDGIELKDSETIEYDFNTEGYKKISATLIKEDKQYTDSIIVWVK